MSEYIKRKPKKVRRTAATRTRTSRRPVIPDYPVEERFVLSEQTYAALVAEAVDYVQATIDSGAVDAARNRVAAYAGEKLWSRLTQDWHGRNCKDFAALARLTIKGKDWVHRRIGIAAGVVLERLGMPRVASAFGRELARRIPMPWDQQLVIVARGLQIAGVVICVVNDRELARCHCFVDVVVTEGKAVLEELIKKAAGDWRSLDQLLPVTVGSSAIAG